jgi:GxxExxY protein
MDPEQYPKPDAELERITHEVIGAAIEVHKHLGPGHLEQHYEAALCHELDLRGIRYQRQVPIELKYKDKVVGQGRLDLFVEGRLVVELKAVEHIADVFLVTVKSYIRIINQPLGLVLNFQVPLMTGKEAIRRVMVGRV